MMALPPQLQMYEPMMVDLPDEIADEAVLQYTVDNASLDVEAYGAHYTGLIRVRRLVFVAEHCPALRVEAYRLALDYTQNHTMDVANYIAIHKQLADAAASLPPMPGLIPGQQMPGVPPYDKDWVDNTRRGASLKREKLDTELKGFKANSIKESIRRGHDDLGEHYLNCGDLSGALKCFSRSRDYCTSATNMVKMCLNVILASAYLNNWTHVLSYVNKAGPLLDATEANTSIRNNLFCAAGLAELACKRYKKAAQQFLQTNTYFLRYPQLISSSNVAAYGALCALATYDRQDLHLHVISSSEFKLFLELEPQVREALNLFFNSKYAACLNILEELKDNFLLDLYLAPHVHTLYAKIRSKSLCQYFRPYVSARMDVMAAAFNTTVPELEEELVELILSGQIHARIDSHNKILRAKDTDSRAQTFEKALQLGQNYLRDTRALIIRSAIHRNGILVKNAPSEGSESDPTVWQLPA